MKGIVKWYNVKKGYGFIAGEEGKDVFMHKSAIPEEIGSLQEGDKVEYEIEETERGVKAINLEKI